MPLDPPQAQTGSRMGDTRYTTREAGEPAHARSADGSSQQPDEVLDAEINLPEDRSQSAAVQLTVSGHHRLRKRVVPPEDDVAPVLATNTKPHALQRGYYLQTGNPRQLTQTASSSASSLSMGTGKPSSSSTWT